MRKVKGKINLISHNQSLERGKNEGTNLEKGELSALVVEARSASLYKDDHGREICDFAPLDLFQSKKKETFWVQTKVILFLNPGQHNKIT